MPKIYDPDGNEIADFVISPKQEAGAESRRGNNGDVSHPAIFRGTLGQLNGAFTLRQIGERVVTSDTETCAICTHSKDGQASARATAMKPNSRLSFPNGAPMWRCSTPSLPPRWRTYLPE